MFLNILTYPDKVWISGYISIKESKIEPEVVGRACQRMDGDE